MATLPLFYQSLAVFNQEQHGKLSFPAQAPNYSFAAQANIVPLLVNEASQAVRHYPLVFVPGGKDEPLVLAAMVGLGDGVNRFVDGNKQWRANTYTTRLRAPISVFGGQHGRRQRENSGH